MPSPKGETPTIMPVNLANGTVGKPIPSRGCLR
jgi:hypothetical protein